MTAPAYWTKAERDGICDVALMNQTRPNELHRAKRTLNALLHQLEKMCDEMQDMQGDSNPLIDESRALIADVMR